MSQAHPPALADHLRTRPEYRDPAKRARLAYLYSDLSQARSNNPTSYASCIAWWTGLIQDIVARGLQSGGGSEMAESDKLVWHLDQDFVDRLRWEGAGRPTGLGTIANQLSQSTQIMPLSVFSTSQKPIDSFSYPRWIVSKLVAAPLWWSMGKLGVVDTEAGMSEERAWKVAKGDWVVIDALKKAADAVTEHLQASSTVIERLYTRDSFTAEFSARALPNVRLSPLDMQVLLRYLQRDRRVLVADKDTIKILSTPERTAASVAEITEAEKGILQVKSTSQALEEQIADLEARIAERQNKITSYIRSNQKDLALSYLRSKKALLDLLSKRTLAYENLSAVLLRIEAAEGDVAIMSAYQSATTSLKTLLAHPSLQRGNVENTMDDLRETLADQKEIEEIVTSTGEEVSGINGDEVDEEIREELERLQEEADLEKRKKEDEEKVRQRQAEEQTSQPEKVEAAKEKDKGKESQGATERERVTA